jgi:DNA-directed RNA polymerase subunit RPC12/RpoP
MDVAAFEHWLGEIAALNLLQRRQAWQALALSEASDSYDGETGEPLGAGIASVSIAEAPGEPSAAMTSSAVRPLNRVGTDFVAELGQRRVDSIGCPHCGSRDVVHWGKASDLPRYRCKGCRRTFNALTKTPLAHLRKKDKWVA